MSVQATTAVERLADPITGGPLARARGDRTALDTDIGKLLLDGRRLDARIEDVIVGGELERTIEGASTLTLTLNDHRRALLESGIFERQDPAGTISRVSGPALAAPTISIPGPRRRVHFSLAALEKQDDDLALTFEDREVAWLRLYDEPRKAYRNRMTRAEFVLALVREVKQGRIRTYIPELHKRQTQKPIRRPTDRRSRSADDRLFGLGPNMALKIKGARATPYQINNCERVLNTGVSAGAPYTVLVASMVTIIEEATARNPSGGDRDSVGAFQQRRSQGWPATGDLETDAREFFKRANAIYKAHPGYPAWRIAFEVQRNYDTASQGRNSYGDWLEEAKVLVQAYSHDELEPGGTATGTVVKRFAFTRGQAGKRETSWAAILRLAEEVRWRAFMVEGTLFFVSEDDLFRARPRMRLSEHADGVDRINFNWDTGRRIGEATVLCRADLWQADPGTVVLLEDMGPADGRWLVSSIRRGLFDPAAEITLKKPMHERAEPAPETESGSIDRAARRRGGGGGSGDTVYDAVYDEAVRISERNLPYTWGGGHNASFAPRPGYDCSGYVSACLHAAGLLDSPLASGGLAGWGKPGVGKHFTVYANAGHVFMHFYGRSHKRADTGGGPPSGPHVRSSHRGTGGFTARHWPGQ